MLRLKELREDRDLRQSDLARATRIDQRTISNYETGKSNPDSYALIKLADFFEVSVDYLLGRTERDLSTSADKKQAIDDIKILLDRSQKHLINSDCN